MKHSIKITYTRPIELLLHESDIEHFIKNVIFNILKEKIKFQNCSTIEESIKTLNSDNVLHSLFAYTTFKKHDYDFIGDNHISFYYLNSDEEVLKYYNLYGENIKQEILKINNKTI